MRALCALGKLNHWCPHGAISPPSQAPARHVTRSPCQDMKHRVCNAPAGRPTTQRIGSNLQQLLLQPLRAHLSSASCRPLGQQGNASSFSKPRLFLHKGCSATGLCRVGAPARSPAHAPSVMRCPAAHCRGSETPCTPPPLWTCPTAEARERAGGQGQRSGLPGGPAAIHCVHGALVSARKF